MPKPIDFATDQTVAFIEAHVSLGARIAEVGCGSGEVAARLVGSGYQVTGIESDSECVARCTTLGLDVVHSSWLDYQGGPFDAVVFTRSLHHIHDLDEAVKRAVLLMPDGGKLLCEDFAIEALDLAALHWLKKLLESEEGQSLVDASNDEFISGLLESEDGLSAMHDYRAHDIHSFGEMQQTIAARAESVSEESLPYLYRHLVPVLPSTGRAAEFLAGVFADEALHAELDVFPAVGRRIVAVTR